jgi:hypothetical protein
MYYIIMYVCACVIVRVCELIYRAATLVLTKVQKPKDLLLPVVGSATRFHDFTSPHFSSSDFNSSSSA